MSSSGPAPVPVAERTLPPAILRHGVVAIVVAAFVTGIIGTALSPTLIVDHPLVMILMNANNRYLILVTNNVDPFGFFLAALFRRVIPTLAFFALGYWYGGRAVRWLEGRDPTTGELYRIIEGWFDRIGWWIVAIAPMTFVALLAGAAKFRPRVLIPLVTVSVFARLAIIRWLGSEFSGVLENIVDWIDRTRGPLMVVTVGLVLLSAWMQRGKRAESFEELTTLDEPAAPQGPTSPNASTEKAAGTAGDSTATLGELREVGPEEPA